MNRYRWHKTGYKVILKGSDVYLYHPATGVFKTENNNGAWREYDNPKKAPWQNVTILIMGTPLQKEIKAIAEVCYCSENEHCDFCTTLRTPPSLLKLVG